MKEYFSIGAELTIKSIEDFYYTMKYFTGTQLKGIKNGQALRVRNSAGTIWRGIVFKQGSYAYFVPTKELYAIGSNIGSPLKLQYLNSSSVVDVRPYKKPKDLKDQYELLAEIVTTLDDETIQHHSTINGYIDITDITIITKKELLKFTTQYPEYGI